MLDCFGERMLFQPWRSVEELHHYEKVSEEEKEKQRQNRLELFPMGIFSRGQEDSSRRREGHESDFSEPGEAE